MSFRLRAIFGVALTEAIFLSILLWISLTYLYETNEEQIRNRAHATADLIASASADAVLSQDLATLQRIVDQASTNNLVERIEVFDRDGVLLAADQATTHDEALNASLYTLESEADIGFYGQRYGHVVVVVSTGGIIAMLEHVAKELLLVAALSLLIVAVLSYVLGSWLMQGLGRLQGALQKFAHGEVVNLPEGKDELGKLAASFNSMVFSLTTETARAERFRRQAQHDSLTGLLNREQMLGEIQIMMDEALAKERLMAVVYMDLNRFKRVNDEYGHAVGDHILRTIAQRLQTSFRVSDRLFRVGGDEFVLLLSNLRNVDLAEELLLRVMAALQNPIQCSECPPIKIGASMGVVYYPLSAATDPVEILSEADRAMYAAKHGPEPNLRVFEPSMLRERPPVPIDPR
jgi:diguanylate cyclase (GGDEF)-like protein